MTMGSKQLGYVYLVVERPLVSPRLWLPSRLQRITI